MTSQRSERTAVKFNHEPTLEPSNADPHVRVGVPQPLLPDLAEAPSILSVRRLATIQLPLPGEVLQLSALVAASKKSAAGVRNPALRRKTRMRLCSPQQRLQRWRQGLPLMQLEPGREVCATRLGLARYPPVQPKRRPAILGRDAHPAARVVARGGVLCRSCCFQTFEKSRKEAQLLRAPMSGCLA